MIDAAFAIGKTLDAKIVVDAARFGARDAYLCLRISHSPLSCPLQDRAWCVEGACTYCCGDVCAAAAKTSATATRRKVKSTHTSQWYLVPPSLPRDAAFFLMTPMLRSMRASSSASKSVDCPASESALSSSVSPSKDSKNWVHRTGLRADLLGRGVFLAVWKGVGIEA
jgi:hypothetical protein